MNFDDSEVNIMSHFEKYLFQILNKQMKCCSIFQIKRDEQVAAKRNSHADGEMSDDFEDYCQANQYFNLDELATNAKSKDPTRRFEAVHSSRKLLSIARNPPIDELIQSNFLPIFVEYLMYDQYPDLQFEAAWALTNVASGNSYQTQAVANANAIPYLVRLLNSPHSNVCEQAVWALGNLIGKSNRNQLVLFSILCYQKKLF